MRELVRRRGLLVEVVRGVLDAIQLRGPQHGYVRVPSERWENLFPVEVMRPEVGQLRETLHNLDVVHRYVDPAGRNRDVDDCLLGNGPGADDAQLGQRFDGFEVVAVSTDGQTVTVTMRAEVRMPFLNLISSRYRDGYPVEATAIARSPFVPD